MLDKGKPLKFRCMEVMLSLRLSQGIHFKFHWHTFKFIWFQLVDGVEFTIRLEWSAGDYSGSDSITVAKDTTVDAAVFVEGITNEAVDPATDMRLSCKFETCFDVVR